MEKLPIHAFEAEIVQTVRENPVTVIAAKTGAGKSTRVPLMLLAAGFGKQGMIGITLPRRVAVINVSEYVTTLHGTKPGETIGYQIRNDRSVGAATRVKFMTEGILLRELHSDPELRRYEVVIVDEAHERGVNQDLILALLKKLQNLRPTMKIVIMSATIDEERFSQFFGNAPIVKVPGRVFPVEIRYAAEEPEDVGSAIAQKVEEIVRSREDGDILVFLPDEKSIRSVCDKLDEARIAARILPLYGNQSPDEQRAVFMRCNERRVIVATNIAETSITIDGVVHVVDSGLIKQLQYVSASMSALRVADHSQAGCNQRAGRAGRTQPGICHRLFTEESFQERPPYTEPEIKRMSLDAILLKLRVLGYSMDDVLKLEFMDQPGEARWMEAAERLTLLGALDKDGNVTEDGRRMERLPVAPMLGRMLLTAEKFGCVEQVATVVAGFTARPVFVRPRGEEKEDEADRKHAPLRDKTSDALTLLKVHKAWTARREREEQNAWARDHFLSYRALRDIDSSRAQILGIMANEGVTASRSDDPTLIQKAVAAGLLVNLCVHSGRFNYRWGERSDVFIHPSSSLFGATPRMLVCASVVETTKTFARDCTAIEEAWLAELIPEHALEKKWSIDTLFGETRLIEEVFFQGLIIRSREVQIASEEELPPELLEKYRAALAQLPAWMVELHQRKAAEKAESEEKLAPYSLRLEQVRYAYDKLAHEAIPEKDRRTIQQLLAEISYRVHATRHYLSEHAFREIDADLARLERLIGQFREAQDEARQIKEILLAAIPEKFGVGGLTCPLCDTPTVSACAKAHDKKRLLPFGGATHWIARIRTDNGVIVWQLLLKKNADGTLGVYEEPDYRSGETLYSGKPFATLTCEESGILLPEELVLRRDEIIADLQTLKELKREVERDLKAITDAEAAVTRGEMVKLTFADEKGELAARRDGKRYVATFAEKYP
ncbi:MAG: ATP-dependent RNA helicase, partial [Patescibacteria group bacterium]